GRLLARQPILRESGYDNGHPVCPNRRLARWRRRQKRSTTPFCSQGAQTILSAENQRSDRRNVPPVRPARVSSGKTRRLPDCFVCTSWPPLNGCRVSDWRAIVTAVATLSLRDDRAPPVLLPQSNTDPEQTC